MSLPTCQVPSPKCANVSVGDGAAVGLAVAVAAALTLAAGGKVMTTTLLVLRAPLTPLPAHAATNAKVLTTPARPLSLIFPTPFRGEVWPRAAIT
jgi:hypothetical protein